MQIVGKMKIMRSVYENRKLTWFNFFFNDEFRIVSPAGIVSHADTECELDELRL